MLQDIFKDFDESLLIIIFLVILLMGDGGFGSIGKGSDDILILIFLVLLLTGGIF